VRKHFLLRPTIFPVIPAAPEKTLQLELNADVPRVAGSRESLHRTIFFLEGGVTYIPFAEFVAEIRIDRHAKGDAAAFGKILVYSNMKGADIKLDGGVVATVTKERAPVELRNILVGDHELSVTDASGRLATRIVRVEKSRTTLVVVNDPISDWESAKFELSSLGKNSRGYQEYRRKMDGAVVVQIPRGEFLMGNKETERNPLEHKVYVSDFLIDKTAVTFGQYKRFLMATEGMLPPSVPYWGVLDDHPAVFVNWDEAKSYCEWAGGRLPTEAEREKAARGTDRRKFPWGAEEPSPELSVNRRSWGLKATETVGTHPKGASPYGALDMGGNVWEWCSDWYDEKYYEVSSGGDPKGPRTGSGRVVRGGSWDSRPDVLSASCRSWGHRGYREGDFGFRCAMDANVLIVPVGN
jgi:formylglycine-generating enzyme required for sulfatase activity